jgi:hypothetical protein
MTKTTNDIRGLTASQALKRSREQTMRQTHQMEGLNMMERETCRCGALEGQMHGELCSLEYCRQCGKQRLWMCRCGPDADRSPFVSLVSWAYTFCARCGKKGELEFFHTLPEEWEGYVEPDRCGKILCRPCFDQVKAWIDEADGSSPDQGPSIAEERK